MADSSFRCAPFGMRNLLLRRNGITPLLYHSACFGRFLIPLRSIRNDVRNLLLRRNGITPLLYHSACFRRFLIPLRSIRNDVRNLLFRRNSMTPFLYHSACFRRFLIPLRSIRNDVLPCERKGGRRLWRLCRHNLLPPSPFSGFRRHSERSEESAFETQEALRAFKQPNPERRIQSLPG